MRTLERFAGPAAVLTGVALPAAVYWGSGFLSTRHLGFVLFLLLAPRALRFLFNPSVGPRAGNGLAAVPAVTAMSVAAAATMDSEFLLLVTPVLVNLFLLGLFGGSLGAEDSMVEKLARLTNPSLSADQRSYCRVVTAVWCGVFLVNAVVTTWLAWNGPLSWWASYTGGFAYLLVGVVFTIEVAFRWYLFGRDAVVPRPSGLAARRP